MKKWIFALPMLAIGMCAVAQQYGTPSIDIVYLLSVEQNDTVCLAAERPKVEFEKEKRSIFGKIKDKTTEVVGNAKDAASDKGWIHTKPSDPVAAPDPEEVHRLDSIPLVTKSFKATGAKSTCVGETGREYLLVVRSNHSYLNPRELVQILPLTVTGGKRCYTYSTESQEAPFQYCAKVEKYDSNGSYLCRLGLPAGEYAVTVADQPTLVQFFSIPE
ncbi:MAG: hypothetical protein LUD17_06525 [Bacteroidales bacterium]|nr:hypothetical protein [Bacteroidales bacterium]